MKFSLTCVLLLSCTCIGPKCRGSAMAQPQYDSLWAASSLWANYKPKVMNKPEDYRDTFANSDGTKRLSCIYDVHSGEELFALFHQHLANKTATLRRCLPHTVTTDNTTAPDIGGILIRTPKPQLHMDRTLLLPAWLTETDWASQDMIFWGPGSPYRDNRMHLICRKATSALLVRSPFRRISNLRISGCTNSAIRVALPSTITEPCPLDPTRFDCVPPVGLTHLAIFNNSAERGGALHVKSGVATISQSELTGNTASMDGGAVYAARQACFVTTTAFNYMYNPAEEWSLLAGNKAPRGGAIFQDDANCTLMPGGEVQLSGVTGALLQGNVADRGGALYVSQTNIDTSIPWPIVDCIFLGNVARIAGGAVYAPNTAQIQILTSQLLFNLAGQEGGAVWASSNIYGTFTIVDTSMQNNQASPGALLSNPLGPSSSPAGGSSTGQATAARNGGALFVAGSMRLDASNCIFASNSADSNGGALYCSYCLFLELNRCNFTANTACSGGAITMDMVVGPSRMTDSLLQHNQARCTTSAAASATASSAPALTVTPGAEQQLTCNRGGGGAVCCKTSNKMGFVNNTFFNNTAAVGGGLFINQRACLGTSQQYAMYASRQSVASPATRSWSTQCATYIYRQNFTANTADRAGGGMFLTSLYNVDAPIRPTDRPRRASTMGDETVQLCNSTFHQDGRYISGIKELFNLRGQMLDRAQNVFQNNNVSANGYGPSTATALACLSATRRVKDPEGAAAEELKHITVANDERFSMRVLVHDAYGQMVPIAVPGFGVQAVADSTPNSNGSGNVVVSGPLRTTFNPQGVLFSNLSVFADEYRQHTLLVTAQGGDGLQSATLRVAVTVRECMVGEVQTGKTCKSCTVDSRSQYSFNPKNATCDTCPGAAKCDGVSIVPEPGFWHASPCSSYIHRCPIAGACSYSGPQPRPKGADDFVQQQLAQGCAAGNLTKGVQEYNQQQCSQGYTGNVCGTCLMSENLGRYGLRHGRCKRCAPQWKALLGYIGLKVVEAALVSCMVVARLMMAKATALTRRRKQLVGQRIVETKGGAQLVGSKDPKEVAAMRWWQRLWVHIQEFGQEAMSNLATLVEILLMYIQMLSLLSTADVNWPLRTGWVFSVLRLPEGSVTWLAPDCMLPPGTAHAGIFRIVVVVLSLAICTALLVGAWLLYARIKQGSALDGTHMVHIAVMVAVSAATFYYPSVTTTMMSVFTCTHLDPAGKMWGGQPSVAASASGWWKQDYNVKCFVGIHRRFSIGFGVPVLVLVGLGVPLGLTWFLIRQRNQLADLKFQAQFGYLYMDFKSQCWFWFCVRFWLLLALAVSIQGLSYFGPLCQLIVMAICLSIFIWITLALLPYQSSLANFIYFLALHSTLLCVLLSFTYVFTEASLTSNERVMSLIITVITTTLVVQLGLLAAGVFNYRKHITRVASAVASTLYQRLNTSLSRTWSRVSTSHGRSDSVSTFRGMSSLASLQSQASHTLSPQGNSKSALPLLGSLRSLPSWSAGEGPLWLKCCGSRAGTCCGGDGNAKVVAAGRGRGMNGLLNCLLMSRDSLPSSGGKEAEAGEGLGVDARPSDGSIEGLEVGEEHSVSLWIDGGNEDAADVKKGEGRRFQNAVGGGTPAGSRLVSPFALGHLYAGVSVQPVVGQEIAISDWQNLEPAFETEIQPASRWEVGHADGQEVDGRESQCRI